MTTHAGGSLIFDEKNITKLSRTEDSPVELITSFFPNNVKVIHRMDAHMHREGCLIKIH